MSEYSSFVYVNRTTLGPCMFVGCHRMSENSGVGLHKFYCIGKNVPEFIQLIYYYPFLVNKIKRQSEAKRTLLKTAPDADERLVIHEYFLKTLDPR